MNTLEAITKRGGCRKYLDEPVDKEMLGTVLDAGRMAPSAGNLQDRSFIIVKDENLKSEIAKAAGNQTWIQTAPVVIIVLAENKKVGKFFGIKGEKVYAVQDTAFAVENMLLAAVDLGLGCALVVGFNEQKLKDLLKIEPPAEPYAIVTLGHAAEPSKPSSKYPLDRFVFFDKYGSRVVDVESAFGQMEKAKAIINTTAEKSREGMKKTASDVIEKIKSLFKRKKKEELPAEDHFMEPVKIEELKPEEKEEIPRQLPRK